MKMICQCGRKAIYNARYVNNPFTLEGKQIAIDGKDQVPYIFLCVKCYDKEKNKIDNPPQI